MRTLACSLLALLFAATAGAITPIAGLEFTDVAATGPVTAITADRAGERLWYTNQPFARLGSIDIATKQVRTWEIRPPAGETVLTIGSPQGIVVAPNNKIYFPVVLNLTASTAASAIVKFDPLTELIEFYKTPDPFAWATTIAHITAGNDAVYVTRAFESKIQRMSFDGAMSVIDVATPAGARAESMKGIAVGDNRLWVTNGFRSVFEVPLAGGSATEHRFTGGGFRSPRGIAAGSDGMYLVMSGTSAEMGNKIGRIAFQGGLRTEWDIPTPDSAPVAIAAAPNGKFYFTEEAGKQIGEFDPGTGVIRESAVPNGRTPLSIGLPFSFGPTGDARLVFNSFPPGSQDGVATLASIRVVTDPDLEASFTLSEGEDAFFTEGFRAGSLMSVTIVAHNISTTPTAGPTVLEFKLGTVITAPKQSGFFRGDGTCATAGGTVTCTTPNSVNAGDFVSAVIFFDAPRPPANIASTAFNVSLNVKNASDLKTGNNTASDTIRFVVARDYGLLRIPNGILKPTERR